MAEKAKIKSDDLVILVHGTYASTEKGWASRQSEFTLKLLQFYNMQTERNLNFTTFSWSGENSLYERQSAAINLAVFLNLNTINHKRIHLIGHSHGGNVIQYALQSYPQLTSDMWKLKVASWTTIGTPFYRFKGNLKLKDSQIRVLSFMFSTTIAVILQFLIYGLNSELKAITFFIFFILFVIFERFFDASSIQYRIDRVNSVWKDKWFGVYSSYDEAIVGLSNNLKFKISNSKRIYPTLNHDVNPINYIGLAFNTLLYNTIIRHIKTPILNNIILKKTLGLDRPFYSIEEVQYKPHPNAPSQPIPEHLEEELIRIVINDNKLKIDSIRRLLNIKNQSLFESLSAFKDEQQPKLIHSLYFENDKVIKAIVNHIIRQNAMFNPKSIENMK